MRYSPWEQVSQIKVTFTRKLRPLIIKFFSFFAYGGASIDNSFSLYPEGTSFLCHHMLEYAVFGHPFCSPGGVTVQGQNVITNRPFAFATAAQSGG